MPLSALLATAFLNTLIYIADNDQTHGTESTDLAKTACKEIAALANEFSELKTSKFDGAVHDGKTGLDYVGCRMVGAGAGIDYRDDKWPHDILRMRMMSDNWQEDISRAADGAGSTAFALRKGAVLCVFSASWIITEPFEPDAAEARSYKFAAGCFVTDDSG